VHHPEGAEWAALTGLKAVQNKDNKRLVISNIHLTVKPI
jgi:hypothetical protein